MNKHTLEIQRMMEAGMKQSEMAKALGIHKSYVSNLIRDITGRTLGRTRLTPAQAGEAMHLYERGYSMREIWTILNVTEYDIKQLLRGKSRSYHESNHLRAVRLSNPLNESQIQCLLGTLLGDGSIRPNQNRGYRVSIKHGIDQLDYVQHKANILGVPHRVHTYKPNIRSYSTKGSCGFTYQNAGGMKYIESLTIRDGVKTVNTDWLDRLNIEGIAYWFMDDGSSSFVGKSIAVQFSTLGFPEDITEMLRGKLECMGFKTSKYQDRRNLNSRQFFLSMSRHYTIDFLKSISPYVSPIDCMRYKIKL